MPKGPQGQERPADVIGCAIIVASISTGEIEETTPKSDSTRSGAIGAKVYAEKPTQKEWSAIAKKATAGRWK